MTISNSFARTSGTYEKDARHKALGFEPVTFDLHLPYIWIRFQRRLDSEGATTNLGIFAEIQTLDPSLSRQPHLAHPESNPGLQVSTFSRDARTPGTKKKLAFNKVDEIRTRDKPHTSHSLTETRGRGRPRTQNRLTTESTSLHLHPHPHQGSPKPTQKELPT